MPQGDRRAGTFIALQRLARSIGDGSTVSASLRRDAAGLGLVALPLCLRELASLDPARRRVAVGLLLAIAAQHRARVVAEVRLLIEGAGDGRTCTDGVKVAALSLLADLDEPAPAPRFADPADVHRRSLSDLAELLTSAPDVALAGDLLLEQLDGEDLIDFVDGLIQSRPTRASHLVDELLGRTELDAGVRAELRRIGAPLALIADQVEPLRDHPLGPPRLHKLRDAAGRVVVIVSRRGGTGRRCLGLLIGVDGALGDAMHRDDAAPEVVTHEIVAPLCDDGYAPITTTYRALCAEVAAAARRTVEAGARLPGAYYLGRDLLELGDAHVQRARPPDPHVTLLGRATDLLGRGEHERARPLFERCAAERPQDAEVRSGLGLCLLAAGEIDAAAVHLEQAAGLDPSWATHLWNLAALRHRQGRSAACYLALRRFRAGADRTPAAARDAAHAQRVALAGELLAAYERRVHLEQPGCDALRFAEIAEGLRAPPRRRAPAVSGRRRRSTLRQSPARP